MSTDLHPCARCAAVQATCCQRAEIVLTTGDVARIAAHTGREDFFHRARPLDPDAAAPDPHDPNWVRYTVAEDGTRRVLRCRDGAGPGHTWHPGRPGDCTFLGPGGCVLPEAVRPLVCRLYPFMYSERGLDRPADPSGGVDESYCPTWMFRADHRAGGHPTMLTVLGMDPRVAEGWRAQLYEELRNDAAG